MSGVTGALRWILMKDTSSELAVAQLRELLRHFPMLHMFLAANVLIVAYAYYGKAPAWLTVEIPAALILCNLSRLYFWRRVRRRSRNRASTLKLLRGTSLISICFAGAYIGWALALNSYGDPIARAQIAVYIAMTAIGFIFCMVHLPQAAAGIAAIIAIPFVAYHVAQGDIMFSAIALDVVLIIAVVFRVLVSSFRSFRNLVRSKEEAERLNGEVMLLAHTDMLTGLPNRRLFFRELERMLAHCRSHSLPFTLGIIDLDRFKIANDTFGHQLGDDLLEIVGARLQKVFGRGELIARLGGDEFAFAVLMDADAAAVVGEEACKALAAPYKLGDNFAHIGASCGIASCIDPAISARILYDNADYALYQAKNHRPGTVVTYSKDHERKVNAERAIEMALQAADFHAELDLHLQPIVETATGTIVTVEALARWNSPQLGNIRPDVFIPIAERAGLTHRMTLSLFQKALTYAGLLPQNIRLSFNLSAHDLTSETTVLAIIALMLKSSITPSRILFELTETAAVRDFGAAEQSIRTLRSIGVRIALDDFGTGQSSLSYLHRLPIDKVKLDRSFLMEAGGKSGREMLGAVVALCHSMQMKCVAEGVEDGDQLQFLKEIGCDLYQGYHFARPMPLGELLKFLPRAACALRRAS